MLRAIIFDFDGTILDSETHEYHSWLEIYQAYNAQLPLEVWLQVVGTVSTEFDPHRHLEEQVQQTLDRATLREQRRQRFMELIDREPLLPGVVELIAAAREAGLRLGVASSGTRDWVEGHLIGRGLRHSFSVVRTSADVSRVKPDPELYLSAAAGLGVDPHNAVAIEDSRHGLVAAKAAGMKCVVVPNSITAGLDFSASDLVVPSLHQVTIGQVAALWTTSNHGLDG